MDAELISVLRGFMAGSLDRREVARFVHSLDIWNRWQDGAPDIEAVREILDELELVLADVAEGFRDEQELRTLVAGLLAQSEQDVSPPPRVPSRPG